MQMLPPKLSAKSAKLNVFIKFSKYIIPPYVKKLSICRFVAQHYHFLKKEGERKSWTFNYHAINSHNFFMRIPSE